MRPCQLYANAFISVRSYKQMFTQARIRAMINAETIQDAAKVLLECGYSPQLISTSPEKDDEIVATERAATVEKFTELCSDANLLYCVIAKFNYHNAGLRYKNSLGLSELDETLYPFADYVEEFSTDALSLPKPLKEAFMQLKNISDVTATQIDSIITHALYTDIASHVKKIKNKAIRNYFAYEVDFLNIRAVIKGMDANLLPGGKLNKQQVTAKAAEIKDLNEFEDESWAELSKLSAIDNNDIFKLNLLFYWFMRKQEELRVVKTILMGKKFGFTNDQIRESLGGLYGRF
ncbi:MAG: V-type ATPase subunit [Firmicutes bacterium]|nr:V-type ATPase subunit [Bacillota bacterium]